jgi:hypothetical protein
VVDLQEVYYQLVVYPQDLKVLHLQNLQLYYLFLRLMM